MSPEAQALFKLLAIAGEAAHQTALLLVRYDFDLSRAALETGLADNCPECAAGRRKDLLRGCTKHQCRIRQRACRAVSRMRALLPKNRSEAEGKASFAIPNHRRPKVRFGADNGLGATGGGPSIYEMAAAPEEEVDELEAMADELLKESADA